MSSVGASEMEYESLPGRVLFGAGSITRIAGEVDRLGCRRVLLIDGLIDSAVSQRMARDLGSRHAESISISRQHVPAELAQAASASAQASFADCLLSVGGGSSLGVAKAIARETGLAIIAVPTTYAGSEMTPIWGITADGDKTTGRDVRVLPRTVIYDPELTLSLSPAATGASGMNAVAHCVEALWTERRNPVTDAIATEGIALLATGLRRCVVEPRDLEARGRALRGAWLGGLALAGGGTGLHHKICHVLGGSFGLPHAEVHAAVLPWVVAHYREAAPDALRRVAAALGTPDAFVGLLELSADVGAGAGLAALGLDDAGAVSVAEKVAPTAPEQPAPTTREQVTWILRAAMRAT
jgi:maleylacetate reductase